MINFGKSNITTKIIAGFIIVISGIVLFISINNANKLRDEVAYNQLKMLVERTEANSSTFYKELNTSLKTIAGLISSGIFLESDISNWSSGLLPVLQSNLNITAFSLADTTGSEYVISLKDSVLSYYFLKSKNQDETTFYVKDLVHNSIQKTDTTISVKATSLASYTDFKESVRDSIVWQGLQAIPGNRKMAGNAATLKILDSENNLELTLSIYVSIEKLHDFLKANADMLKGEILLFTEDMRFFNFENGYLNESTSDLSDFLISWDEVKNPLLKKAMEVGKNINVADSMGIQSFEYNNKKYWGAYQKSVISNNKLKIALIIPEDDFFVVLKGKLGFIFFSSIGILIITTLVLFLIFFKNKSGSNINEPVENEDILNLIKRGENEFAEFKSTIRMNLFSKKTGKEIELAWLKSVVAFCNTKGGTIIIGVTDDGEILGLDSDNFKNDDKCLLHVQSLLRDHVGMEFSKYINYRLVEIDNKKILTVHCTSSLKPLFLMANNKEQFYVRSGPASIELPTSKAIKYIEDRKKDS